MSRHPIAYFGSGPVADASLQFLHQHFDIEAVITKPQPPHHKAEMSTIALARELSLPCFTPANKAELDALLKKQSFVSNVGVVIDYGIIISRQVIDTFPMGIINSHFSLLPELRGADPITFAILSGQPTTGVSLMRINERMDEGPLLAQELVNIAPDDTTPSLTKKLVQTSNLLLKKHLPKYLEGQLEFTPQTGTPTYSRKLTKQDGQIDWTKPAEQIEREIRAFIDWPKSFTSIGTKDVIITKSQVVPSNHEGNKPGDVEIIKEAGIIGVECGKGYLCIDRLKPAGKSEMTASAFIAGYGHLFDNP